MQREDVGKNRERLAVQNAESVATAQRMSDKEIAKFSYDPARNIWLGKHQNKQIGFEDDRHRLTGAGTRSGKGTSSIVPVLCEYQGSVFVLDPKGENAKLTAERRGQGNADIDPMGQKVTVLDPYAVADVPQNYKGAFNPIEWVSMGDNGISEADTLAESLIMFDGKADPHWTDNAQAVLQALILHVRSWKYIKDEDRHLIKVRKLLMSGDLDRKENILKKLRRDLSELELELESPDDPDDQDSELLTAQIEQLNDAIAYNEKLSGWDHLLKSLKANKAFNEHILSWAESFDTSAPNERAGFLSSARTNTKFLDDPQMLNVLATSTFSLRDFRESPNGFSLYLCLPIGKIGTAGRWLRAMLTQTLRTFEDMGEADRTKKNTLFVLDEFHGLGHMQPIEKYSALIASYGVTLWYILQDLQQLKKNYSDSWETILNTIGVMNFFGIDDAFTTKYLSEKLGKVEIRRDVTTQSEADSTTESENTGQSEGFAPGTNFGGNAEEAQKAIQTNSRQHEFIQTGQNTGKSEGKSHSKTTSTAPQFTQANLFNPDELALFFAREASNQLVMIKGHRPMVIARSEYYYDRYFHRKFKSEDDSAMISKLMYDADCKANSLHLASGVAMRGYTYQKFSGYLYNIATITGVLFGISLLAGIGFDGQLNAVSGFWLGVIGGAFLVSFIGGMITKSKSDEELNSDIVLCHNESIEKWMDTKREPRFHFLDYVDPFTPENPYLTDD